MQLKREDFCPIIKEPCRGLNCNFYIHLRGRHPQTGIEMDEWGCSFAWLPVLMVETAKEVRQGAAATESFRNMMFQFAYGASPQDVIEHKTGKLLNGS